MIVAALLASALASLHAIAQDKPVSAQAAAIFEQSRDSIAQIRVLLGGSDSHIATGTGFIVGAGGVMLTNYHVVAEKALEPGTYRLEFVLPGGRRGALRILALDVAHDLAVVQGDVGDAKPLPLRERMLSKGDRALSLGYPLDQGLTVTEGTYNGRSEEQYYDHLHFTGALNAGMSGGPAMDIGGRVFGVNVSSHHSGQLVNFLVPIKYATTLLKRASAAPAGDMDFRNEIGAQLRAHGDALMEALLGTSLSVEKLGEFSLPAKAGDIMRCGASTDRELDRWYAVDTYRCRVNSTIYIDSRLHTGTVSFRHHIFRSERLGALRFAHLQESRFSGSAFGRDRKHHTRYRCRDRIVSMKGTRAKAVMCVRAYRQFSGLYDVTLRLATVGDSGRALHSHLDLQGVAFDTAMTFARRYLERIEWNR